MLRPPTESQEGKNIDQYLIDQPIEVTCQKHANSYTAMQLLNKKRDIPVVKFLCLLQLIKTAMWR